MKDLIKWVAVGVAVGGACYGIYKGAEWFYENCIKEAVENPEYDEIMSGLKEDWMKDYYLKTEDK